jgi:hypothetical protein
MAGQSNRNAAVVHRPKIGDQRVAPMGQDETNKESVMSTSTKLSGSAPALFRLHAERHGKIDVDDANPTQAFSAPLTLSIDPYAAAECV